MTTILQTTHSQVVFFIEKSFVFIDSSLKFALVQVKVWFQTDDKPKPKPLMGQYNETHKRRPAPMY